MQMVIYTRLIQSIWVISEYDYDYYLNLVLLNSIIYVHLSSNGTGSTSGSLSVVFSVSEVYVYYEYTCNLFIRPCIFLCAFL